MDSIREDVRWLGFDWAGEHYASDYFQFLYDYAEYLVQTGKAYVCDLSDEEIRDYRGNFFKAGQPSPYRDRSVAENLELFRAMRAGAFPDGSRVLRAKIDMASPNMNLRDPLMYRIRRVAPPPHRPRLADLSHVRLRPRRLATPSSGSPTPSAPWSSRTTGRCTTGSWSRTWTASSSSARCPGRSSSPGSTSPTPS